MTISPIYTISGTSTVHLHNLSTLVQRQRGQQFMVNKNGELNEISGFFNTLYYFFFREKEQANVQIAITNALSKIDSTKTGSDVLKKLFFDTLKPLSENVYDRGEISHTIIRVLADKSGETAVGTLSLRVEQVRFAIKLGVDFQAVSEGQNGTYYGRDYTGKRLVVFKPFDEESTSGKCAKGVSKIKSLLFRIFPFLKTHENIKRDCAYLNEIGASRVDSFLNLGVVPETRLETFDSDKFEGEETSKKGSCQLYVENTTMMQEAIGLPSFNGLPFFKRIMQKLWLILFGSHFNCPYTIEDLKKLAIIEFLTGNQDGHTNNQLVKGKKIRAIDYGLAFPDKPPQRVFSTVNQYHFAHLPGAEQSFNAKDQQMIGKLGDLDGLLNELEKEMTDGEVLGFDANQSQAMRERVEILKAVISQGKSISYLGEIKFACDFERAKQELGLSSGG